MNAIAEQALLHEVSRRAAMLANSYERAAAAMRDGIRPRLAELIDEIADNEATAAEPVAGRRIAAVSNATFEDVGAHARRVG